MFHALFLHRIDYHMNFVFITLLFSSCLTFMEHIHMIHILLLFLTFGGDVRQDWHFCEGQRLLPFINEFKQDDEDSKFIVNVENNVLIIMMTQKRSLK